LTKLTKKLLHCDWEPDLIFAFAVSREACIPAPVLAYFNYEKELIIQTDASGYVSTPAISNYYHQGDLHPGAFISK